MQKITCTSFLIIMQIIDVGVTDENLFMHVKAVGLKPYTATIIIYMYKMHPYILLIIDLFIIGLLYDSALKD